MTICRRVRVVNKRLLGFLVLVSLASIPVATASGRGQQGRRDEANAEGVVVAVLLEPGAARSWMDVNSESLGDFAEVWMVRVDHWSRPNGAKYILIEYTHVNRHEPFVKDSELDNARFGGSA